MEIQASGKVVDDVGRSAVAVDAVEKLHADPLDSVGIFGSLQCRGSVVTREAIQRNIVNGSVCKAGSYRSPNGAD